MIVLTSSALEKVRTLPYNSLHIFIEQGGCAEYKYKFTSIRNISNINEMNKLLINDITVLVKHADLEKLSEIEIDFESSLIGSRFIVKENPYAVEKCKCGISFKGKND